MENKVNGIAFYEGGPREGKPLVFVHGFPMTHAMWETQVQEFSKTHRVVSFDVRGHGQSETGDGQFSLEFFVDDLFVLLDHLKLDHVTLCGLSMGGYITLRAAECHPERFSGLVLCDTKSEADGNEAKVKRAGALRALKKDGAAAFAENFVKGVLAEKTLQTNPKLVDSVKEIIRGNSPVGMAGAVLALAARTDTTNALSKMNLPVLILVGEEDKVTPPSVAEAMQKLLPQGVLRVIPGAAHFSNLENPAVFNGYLREWLDRNKI